MTVEQQRQSRYREITEDYSTTVVGVVLMWVPTSRGRAHLVPIGDSASLCAKISFHEGMHPASEDRPICAVCASIAHRQAQQKRADAEQKG